MLTATASWTIKQVVHDDITRWLHRCQPGKWVKHHRDNAGQNGYHILCRNNGCQIRLFLGSESAVLIENWNRPYGNANVVGHHDFCILIPDTEYLFDYHAPGFPKNLKQKLVELTR